MKIMTNLLKDSHDEWLMQTTSSLNQVNPIVDRIIEDESVEGVIMANKEGVPIFTNINILLATTYGNSIHCLGMLSKFSISEIDPFDEVLVVRLKTNKIEVIAAPHNEFNIIVIQHARASAKSRKMMK